MSVWGLSDAAADRLRDLMRTVDGAEPGRGRYAPLKTVFVKCTSATAVGGDTVRDQCYPGIIVAPSSDSALPPSTDGTFGEVLLSIIGTDGAASTPEEGTVYLCVLSGDVPGDASGDIAGRPRAFSIPVPGPLFRGVLLRHTANQSIASATDTALSFDTEVYDEGSYHSTSSNTSRIKIPTGSGGYYLIGGAVQFAASSTGGRAVRIRKNGSTILVQNDMIANAGTGNTTGVVNPPMPVYLAAGDYLELIVWQNSLAALNATAVNPSYPNFWAVYLGNAAETPTNKLYYDRDNFNKDGPYESAAVITVGKVTRNSGQQLTVPRGTYLVNALANVRFDSAGTVHLGVSVCNEGADPASVYLTNTVRQDNGDGGGAFEAVPMSVMIKPGQFHDDGATANIDIHVYMLLDSGSALFTTWELNALRLD